MSFKCPKRIIEENDTVILYLSVNNMHAIEASPQIKNKKGDLVEYVFQTTFGALKVARLIGKEFGSKVGSQTRFSEHTYKLKSFQFPDRLVERLGLCSSADSRTLVTDIATSNPNHLHTGHQYDSAATGNRAWKSSC